MMLKSQPANPAPAESGDGQDETYYTDLLKMKLNNTVWVYRLPGLRGLFGTALPDLINL